MKKFFVPLVAGAAGVSAQAASVLDAAAKTAISTGYENIQDTALDVVTTAWPFMLALVAIFLAPRIVVRLSRMGS